MVVILIFLNFVFNIIYFFKNNNFSFSGGIKNSPYQNLYNFILYKF